MGSELAVQQVKSTSFVNNRSLSVPDQQVLSQTSPYPFLQLQQAIGNRAVQRLVQACPASPGACPTGGACHACPVRVQAKLAVNQPGDAYEQEADRVAELVMTMPQSTGNTSSLNKNGESSGNRTARLDNTRATLGAISLPPSRLNELGPGKELDQETRAFMEPRFGHDFGQVRVHADELASTSAQALSARAYTTGTDIAFAAGNYNPATFTGRKLLAHELAHVIQQSGSANAPAIQRAETDTGGQCAGLQDGAPKLNAYVNQQLAAVRAELAKGGVVEGESTGAFPTPANKVALPASKMVKKAYEKLGTPVKIFLNPAEIWANDNLDKRGGGRSGLFKDVRKGTKYEHAPGAYFHYLAPTVNLNGNCVGTDKIGHMFQQGYHYFMISVGMGKGDVYAKAFGEWSEGSLSAGTKGDPALMKWLKEFSVKEGAQLGYLGLAATGVHSRGDLAANAAGLKFYKDLYANPNLTFDIGNYITADWDEEKSGNIYRKDIGEAVKKAGRINPSDVVLP
jgi:hypothetical protein